MDILARLTDADLQFVAATVLPDEDRPSAVRRLRDNPALLNRLLEDERLIRRIRGEADVLVRISPWLLFSVLLRDVRRALHSLRYTVETTQGERIPVFDAARAGELLDDRALLDYLVLMLTSFTRTESWSLEVEQGGRIQRRRFSDLSSDDMIALAALMPEGLRFPILRRIGDLALFISGVFPEQADPWYRAPGTPLARAGARRTLEEYEEEGRRFYRLAARHEAARRLGLDRILDALADTFPLARKPLNVLAAEYIHTSRMVLFGERR
jgi:hypothetical protein